MMLEFSDTLLDFPFFYRQLGAVPVDKFTAVIYATSPVISSSPLFRLLKNVAKSLYVHKVSGRPLLRAVVRLSPLLRAVVQFVVCSFRLLKNVVTSLYVHKVSSRPC